MSKKILLAVFAATIILGSVPAHASAKDLPYMKTCIDDGPHVPDKWEVVCSAKNATSLDHSYYWTKCFEKRCSVCRELLDVAEEYGRYVPPTCKKNGYKIFVNKSGKKTKTIIPKTHKWTVWEISSRKMTRKCKVCGKKETKRIPRFSKVPEYVNVIERKYYAPSFEKFTK